MPTVPFLGPWQTVQTQSQTPRSASGSTLFAYRCFIKKANEKVTGQPLKWKWIHPLIMTEESTRQERVNV